MNPENILIIAGLIWAALLIPLLLAAPSKPASTAIILTGILLSPIIGWIIYLLSAHKNTKTHPQNTLNPTDPLDHWEMQQRIKQGPPPPPASRLKLKS